MRLVLQARPFARLGISASMKTSTKKTLAIKINWTLLFVILYQTLCRSFSTRRQTNTNSSTCLTDTQCEVRILTHQGSIFRSIQIRPSKLDCLFSTMAILLLHAGMWFIFIIHYHFLPFPNQFGEPWTCIIWQWSRAKRYKTCTHNIENNERLP